MAPHWEGGLVLFFDFRSFIAGALGILIALTVHECFHAWVADRLGDPTARYLGRISLNPLVHLDPLGALMMFMAAISGRGIGWGKPVPVNPRNLRYGPRIGMGIVSFSGPLANVVMATLFGLPIRLSMRLPGTLSELLLTIMFINIGLAVFNLIPLPPLDGYGVLQGILAGVRSQWSYRLSQTLTALERQGPSLLLFLILIDQVLGLRLLGRIMDPFVWFLTRLILGI
jgi:Zn-dependent protease